jgi:hypothetical protein
MSSHNRLSRSARLKKYEAAYDTCIKEINIRKKNSNRKLKDKKETKDSVKSSKVLRKNDKKPRERDKEKTMKRDKEKPRQRDKEKTSERKINIYQKFVKEESKKKKYQGLTAKERMTEIGKVWKQKNKKNII